MSMTTTETETSTTETDAEFDARMAAQMKMAEQLEASGYSTRAAYRVASQSYPRPTGR